MNPKGVNIYTSKYSVRETIDRLQQFLEEHGATIYARIDQQDELRKTGQTIGALEFLMFGNPKAGGALIAQSPLIALDLPLKVIAWEDDNSKVWVACNNAKYIEERYGLPDNENTPLDLNKLINAALGS